MIDLCLKKATNQLSELKLVDRFNKGFIIKDCSSYYPLLEEIFKVENVIPNNLRWLELPHTDLSNNIPFVKHLCLLNPYDYICGIYGRELDIQEKMELRNTKIRNPYNSSYIDAFCSYLLSNIPCFPKYYSSRFGISNEYRLNITDDLDDLEEDTNFINNESIFYDLEVSSNEDEEEVIAILKNIPTGIILVEKMKDTVYNYVNENSVFSKEWKSILFQVAYGLDTAQKQYKFFHNDLHADNVMYIDTSLENIEYENFKIPTFGKQMKIIDFGRSIISVPLKKTVKQFICDELCDGEASGQYNFGEFLDPSEELVLPNPSFDFAYLCYSLLQATEDIPEEIKNALKFWTNEIDFTIEGFELYRHIARVSHNAIPEQVLKHEIFNEFRVTKGNEFRVNKHE